MNARIRGALALALLAACPAAASAQQVWKWSQTPAANASADPAINWATGMAPSAVSPSARAMMAAVAKYRDDTAGRLTTGGTSTAYTVTTNSSYASTPADGTRLTITVHATNGASPTLAIDGGSAFQVQTNPSVFMPAGTLVAGSPYDIVFNSAISAWLLVGVAGTPTIVPIGGIVDYVGTTPPNSNFALPAGQCISRTIYATLFALVGTTFGACDGVTTFGLPDLRGRVVAGLDNLNGTPAGRITVAGGNFDGTVLGGTGGSQNHTLTTAELPVHTPAGTISTFNPASSINPFTPTGSVGINDPGHTHFVPHGNNDLGVQTGVGGPAGSGNGQATQSSTTGVSANFSGNAVTLSGSNITPTFSGSAIGSGNAHTILPPTIMLGKLIRIF